MRFLHTVLVASLMLTTKASDDQTYDGQAAVRGHPKVAAGSGRLNPISETPLMSSEADSEEHTMPLVMTEDNAMMPSEELPNAHESNKAIIDEMSEHDEVISIHEFKEVLHELIEDAVDKIVMKKAGIVGKLKTAKQNLIADNGEATGRNPQQHDPNRNVDDCQCSNILDSRGRGNCMHNDLINGRPWCFLKRFSPCDDEQASFQKRGLFWSQIACDVLSNGSGSPRVIRRKIVG